MKSKKNKSIYEKYVKRAFDIFLACLFLVVFCWLFAIVALLVKIKLGSPILFLQERTGRGEEPFRIIKFRTMTKEDNGGKFDDEKRTTPFGRFLRLSSLDEITQVINVLRGEMSFVGPRPLLTQYLPYYTPEERRRHSVRPGITGLAQVNGRNALESWEKRFEYDLEYVDGISFCGDVKILLKSIITVLKKTGAQCEEGIKEGPLDVVRGGEEGRDK